MKKENFKFLKTKIYLILNKVLFYKNIDYPKFKIISSYPRKDEIFISNEIFISKFDGQVNIIIFILKF